MDEQLIQKINEIVMSKYLMQTDAKMFHFGNIIDQRCKVYYEYIGMSF
jgi:hypothetical protein